MCAGHEIGQLAGVPGHPDRLHRRPAQRAVIVAAAVSEAIAPRVESDTGNDQQIGHDRPERLGHRNRETVRAQGFIVFPAAELEPAIGTDARQRKGLPP